MSGPAIRVEGLTKRYANGNAVDSLSFEVQRGEIFGFLGPNGAGKTTTIKLLCGLAFPTSGRIEVLSRQVPKDVRSISRRVGVIVEEPTFYDHLSAADNLRVFAWTSGRAVSSARIAELLSLVGLESTAKERVRAFSSGMRQRLAIAGAVVHDPELLILDEPTNGLDPLGVRDFRELFRSLAAEGKTIFLSSHQLLEVELLCRRTILINRGRVVRYGALDELLSRSGRVGVKVSDVRAGIEALSKRNIAAHEDGPGWLTVDSRRAEDVLRALASADIFPADVRTPNLEDLFVEASQVPEAAG